MKLYILNNGLYHKCIQGAYDCVYKKKDDVFYCNVCNEEFPSMLAVPFKAVQGLSSWYIKGDDVPTFMLEQDFLKYDSKKLVTI